MSALLHALVALSPSTFQSACTNTSPQPEFESEVLPITSYQCQWKRPSKSKESNLQIIEASFEKPVYGRIRKYSFESLADYDPRPIEFRGTANDNLKIFLGKVHGKALGVSLLLDSSCRCWSTNSEESLAPELPSKSELKYRVQELKKSLEIGKQKMREIEQNTRDQSQSALWYYVRRYRLTASHFGEIYRRRPTTPPQSLVLRILEPRKFFSEATDYGTRNEERALNKESVKVLMKNFICVILIFVINFNVTIIISHFCISMIAAFRITL